MIKFFYDPHPGLGGCVLPLPEAVKKVADELDGKTVTPDYASERIDSAIRKTDSEYRSIKTAVHENIITVEVERYCDPEGTKHCWRVIRFKNL